LVSTAAKKSGLALPLLHLQSLTASSKGDDIQALYTNMQVLHEILGKAAGETAQLLKAAHKAAGAATTCAEDADKVVLELAKTSGKARDIQAQRAQML
jgi:hypothetical protein